MIAGIVLYNPDPIRLGENISSIIDQVKLLLLVDNGSANVSSIKETYASNTKIHFILLNENLGIAAAQNQICQFAKDNSFEWAITLDQDSIAPSNLIEEYRKVLNNFDKSIGMICPRVFDRNFGEFPCRGKRLEIEEITQCIASASAIRISAWEQVGGFCEALFIDSVDFDMCWSLRKKGYRIVRTNNAVLLHEVGHSNVRHFAGKDRLILNHAPIRYYYIMRNNIIVGRRHNRLILNLMTCVRIIYQINRFEENKLVKNKMSFIGLWHGLIGKTGKYGK